MNEPDSMASRSKAQFKKDVPLDVTIRPGGEADCALILQFIRELAEYERLAHCVVVSEEALREHLFGASPRAEVLIAQVAREPVGFALYFHNFSTFLGQPGLYLEDLYVRPEFRGRGIGGTFLAALAGIAIERGCGRMEWAVLDWNQPAIDFYDSLGARQLNDWIMTRISGEALRELARVRAPSSSE